MEAAVQIYVEFEEASAFGRIPATMFKPLAPSSIADLVLIRMSMPRYAEDAREKSAASPGSLKIRPCEVSVVKLFVGILLSSGMQES